MTDVAFRESAPGDLPALEALYAAAFADEDLMPLVGALLDRPTEVVSLVAASADGIAGHIALTRAAVEGEEGLAALLGPLAVAPHKQGRGIGRALVAAGLARLESEGVFQVFVLGDPAFYRRLGFSAEDAVAPPYRLPAEWWEAWRSRLLGDGAQPLKGRLSPPAPWLNPALWRP